MSSRYIKIHKDGDLYDERLGTNGAKRWIRCINGHGNHYKHMCNKDCAAFYIPESDLKHCCCAMGHFDIGRLKNG